MAVLYDATAAPYAGSLLRSVAAADPSFSVELTDTPVYSIARIPSHRDRLSYQGAGGYHHRRHAEHLSLSRAAQRQSLALGIGVGREGFKWAGEERFPERRNGPTGARPRK